MLESFVYHSVNPTSIIERIVISLNGIVTLYPRLDLGIDLRLHMGRLSARLAFVRGKYREIRTSHPLHASNLHCCPPNEYASHYHFKLPDNSIDSLQEFFNDVITSQSTPMQYMSSSDSIEQSANIQYISQKEVADILLLYSRPVDYNNHNINPVTCGLLYTAGRGFTLAFVHIIAENITKKIAKYFNVDDIDST